MAPTQPSTAPPRPTSGSRGEPSGSRHASNEERRPSGGGKSEKDREREREREKEKEKDDPKHVGPWRIGKTIGKGSSGRVKIARHTVTHQYAAVKIVPRPRPTNNSSDVKADKMLLGIEREIVIMKLVEHPNVLRLMDVWETERELYLIMEYVEGGELFDYLVKRGKLHADEALHYFQQIISGVDYCHRFNICHRDLKPENLLLDGEKNIKIADFGMAALERDNKLLETSCGSPHYASPEIVAGLNYHGSSSDIWSCGIILFALLTGRLPFDDENIRHLLAKVKVGRFEMPNDLPGDAKDLIKKMLEVDPKLRITMAEIQVHPWITRKPPRSIHGAPPYVPPSIEQIDHPVSTRYDVDPDILSNLQTLWNGAEQEDIIDALLSSDKTWEKVFYTLLCKYRSRNLENFNMEDEEEVRKPKKAAEKNRQHVATGAIASRSRRSRQSLNNIVAASAAGKRTKPGSGSASPPTITRPAPPIPGPNYQPSSANRNVRPLPIVPASPTPSRPVSNSGPTPPHARVPAIHLQEATPDSHPTSANGTWESAPPSPSPNHSPTVVDTSVAPVLPIHIPQTGDAAMQQFFHDIVGQLQTISLRNSLPASPLNSPSTAQQAAFFSPGHVGGVVGDDLTQFEDAEEDESDAGHSYYASPGSPYPNEWQTQESTSRKQPMIQPLLMNKPPPLVRPRAIPGERNSSNNTYNNNSVNSSNRGSTREASSRTGGSMSRPASALSGHNDKENRSNRNSRATTSTVGSTGMSAQRSAGAEKRATLGLAIGIDGSSVSDGFEMIEGGIMRPQMQNGDGKVKKRHLVRLSPPLQGSAAPASPKNSWFTGLFNWKQLSYILLSAESINGTRLACKKLLEGVGASVTIENADGAATLKCRVTELRDRGSTTGALKLVKFRVEFSNNTNSSASPAIGYAPHDRTTYPTRVTLVMEKGAHSTFKATFNRLRASWKLDDPPNNLAVKLIPSPMNSPNMSARSPVYA